MEIKELKALLNNPAWLKVEQLLQERILKTSRALEVATSELEVYRNQGRLASLRELTALREQLKRIK
jgi:hypothetical protein